MHHLAKLWPRAQAAVSVPRWEGPASNCSSDHFRQRYYEVHDAVGLPNSKPTIMNYSTMAMVWAEIVLHKDVDWRTVYGRNVDRLNRSQHMIPTNWMGPSDCVPQWSNRRANVPTVADDDVDTSQWEVRRRDNPQERNVEDYPISFGTHQHEHPSYPGSYSAGQSYYPASDYGPPRVEAYRPTHYERGESSSHDARQTPEAYRPTHYERGESSSHDAPVSFGREQYPPPTFGAGSSSHYTGDEQYQRDLQAALRQSELEEETRRQLRHLDSLPSVDDAWERWQQAANEGRYGPRSPSRRY